MMTATRSQAQADRDMRLFRLGVRITDLRPEVAERWLLPGEHLSDFTQPGSRRRARRKAIPSHEVS